MPTKYSVFVVRLVVTLRRRASTPAASTWSVESTSDWSVAFPGFACLMTPPVLSSDFFCAAVRMKESGGSPVSVLLELLQAPAARAAARQIAILMSAFIHLYPSQAPGPSHLKLSGLCFAWQSQRHVIVKAGIAVIAGLGAALVACHSKMSGGVGNGAVGHATIRSASG